MPEVYVGAGSNADPARALRRAVAELERLFGALRSSRVYRSAAVGGPAADYLNLVIELSTERDVESVQAALREIELLAGRSRRDPAVCELDLDLLLYGASVDVDDPVLGDALPLIELALLATVGPAGGRRKDLHHE